MSTDTVSYHTWKIPATDRMLTTAELGRAEVMPTLTASVVLDENGNILSEEKCLDFPSCITREAEDVFVGRVLALPGCVSQGATFDEARASLRDALESVLAVHRQQGTEPSFEMPTDDEMPARADLFPVHVNVRAP